MRKLFLLALLSIVPSVSFAREEVDIHREHTFIAFSTSTLETSTVTVALMNNTNSGVVLRIISVKIMADPDAAVTGLNTAFLLRRITGVTVGLGQDATNQIVRADHGDPVLASLVKLTRMPASVSVAASAGSIGSVTMSSEETTAQDNPKTLYEYGNKGDTPLTLRPGQGISVDQGALAVAAGIVGVQIIFTQE